MQVLQSHICPRNGCVYPHLLFGCAHFFLFCIWWCLLKFYTVCYLILCFGLIVFNMSIGLVVFTYPSVCQIVFVHISFGLPNWLCSHVLRFAKLVVFTFSLVCQIGCVHVSFGLPNWLCSRSWDLLSVRILRCSCVYLYPSIWLCVHTHG